MLLSFMVACLAIVGIGCGASREDATPGTNSRTTDLPKAVWVCFELKKGEPMQEGLDFDSSFFDHGFIPSVVNVNFDSEEAKVAVQLAPGIRVDEWMTSLPAPAANSPILERWSVSDSPCV